MNNTDRHNLISAFLTKHNFTQEDFCRIAGINTLALEKFINYEHYVSLHDIKKIANVLDVNVLCLL